jgi:recombination protein RecA
MSKIKRKKTAKSKKTLQVKGKAKGKKEVVRKSLLEEMQERIRADFGKESIMVLGDGEIPTVPVAFSTGIPPLNDAIGIKGYPKGRIIEVYGPESSGKTTLALHAIAECQKAGGVATFIDAEHALDIKYAESLGVDVKRLMVSQPDHGEMAFNIIEAGLDVSMSRPSEKSNIIVVDSVAALTPKAEIEGEIGNNKAGLGGQARMMSEALRKLVSIIGKTNTVLIFINQTRMKINTTGFGGSPYTTTGGNALKFYASVRIQVNRIGSDKQGEKVVANKTKVKIVKNKVAPPYEEFECSIRFGVGFDLKRMNFDKLVKLENVSYPPKQAWITLPDDRKFCGFKGYLDFIEDEENNSYIEGLLKAG